MVLTDMLNVVSPGPSAQVLWEDDFIAVIIKPAGVAVSTITFAENVPITINALRELGL